MAFPAYSESQRYCSLALLVRKEFLCWTRTIMGRDSDSDGGGAHPHQQRRYHDDDHKGGRRRSREYDDDWVYGTFDCFEDPKTCEFLFSGKLFQIKQLLCRFDLGLCGCFCMPCQVRSSASKLGEPSCLYWLMFCFVPCISLSLLRNKVRQK